MRLLPRLLASAALLVIVIVAFGLIYTTHAASPLTPVATGTPQAAPYPATATYPPSGGGSTCSAKAGFCPLTPYPTTHP